MKQLIDVTNGAVLLQSVETADTFLTRLRGLQFRSFLPADSGLFLSPCSSLHTCFMRFPIDVIMLDADNIVVGHRRNIKPWRLLFCEKHTISVIETQAGALAEMAGKHVALR